MPARIAQNPRPRRRKTSIITLLALFALAAAVQALAPASAGAMARSDTGTGTTCVLISGVYWNLATNAKCGAKAETISISEPKKPYCDVFTEDWNCDDQRRGEGIGGQGYEAGSGDRALGSRPAIKKPQATKQTKKQGPSKQCPDLTAKANRLDREISERLRVLGLKNKRIPDLGPNPFLERDHIVEIKKKERAGVLAEMARVQCKAPSGGEPSDRPPHVA